VFENSGADFLVRPLATDFQLSGFQDGHEAKKWPISDRTLNQNIEIMWFEMVGLFEFKFVRQSRKL
jgi:hypothetical protein